MLGVWGLFCYFYSIFVAFILYLIELMEMQKVCMAACLISERKISKILHFNEILYVWFVS